MMTKLTYLLVAALSLCAGAVWAGDCNNCGSCNSQCKCLVPPCPDCPDCSDPCSKSRLGALCGAEHAHKLIDQLQCGDCQDRIKAAKKLGWRLHADWCCTPEVLHALVKALLCDSCWEVRKAAAWAIAYQDARVPPGILSLYLASKLDPHFMVRDAAADALGVLIICRRECYKDLLHNGDELVKKLRGKYNPTSGDCIDLAGIFHAHCGEVAAVAAVPAAPACEVGCNECESTCKRAPRFKKKEFCCPDYSNPYAGTPLEPKPAGGKPEPIPAPKKDGAAEPKGMSQALPHLVPQLGGGDR